MSLVRLLPLGAALLCGVSLSAQSLADMAKRAEEQRKAANGKSRHIELKSAQGVRTVPLDKVEVESLDRYKYSPEGLIAMGKSLAEAERLADSGFAMNTLSQVQRDNYEFGRRNRQWLSAMRARIYRAEAGLVLFR